MFYKLKYSVDSSASARCVEVEADIYRWNHQRGRASGGGKWYVGPDA